MKLGHGGDGGDPVTAQLRELLAIARVDVHEAIHVADAEPLHAVGGMALPVGAKTAKKGRKKEKGLVIREEKKTPLFLVGRGKRGWVCKEQRGGGGKGKGMVYMVTQRPV